MLRVSTIVGYRVTADMDDKIERGYITEQRGEGFSWKWHDGEGKPRPRSYFSAVDLRDKVNRWLAKNGYTRNARLVPVRRSHGKR